MDCPNKDCDGTMLVTNTYKTPAASTQRRECPKCLMVSTSVVLMVNMNPAEGEGARALAGKLMRGHEIKVSLPGPPGSAAQS